MKPTARTLLLALTLLPCRAGGSEFHLTALQQQGRGSALFSSGAYRTVAFSYLYEPAQDPSGPAVQVCFSAASGSTGGTRNADGSEPIKPRGFGSVGLRFVGRGRFRFGAAIDLRVASESKGWSAGDTAGSEQWVSTRTWVSVLAQYCFAPAPVRPILSLTYGLATANSANGSNREIGLAVGVAFGGPNGVPK